MRLADLFQHSPRGAANPDLQASGEAALVDRACHDEDMDARRGAVDRISATEALRRVAVEGQHLDARLRAIGRIEDERVLADIMRERKNPAVMMACFARIHDQEVLGEIARDPRFNIAARRLAVQMFSQPALLEEVLHGLAEPGLRRITEPGSAPPAEQEPSLATIEARVDRLLETYPADVLVEALAAFRDAPGSVVAMGVLLRRGGEAAPRVAEVLVRLLRHARPRVRTLAVQALEPSAGGLHAELSAVAENDPDPRVREAAARVIGPAASE